MRPRLAIKRSNYSRSGAFSARGSTFVLRSVAVAPIALGIATRMSFRSYQDICLTHATRTLDPVVTGYGAYQLML